VQRPEQPHDFLAGGAVEVAGRLVGQENAWAVDQRPGDGHSLPLPAGELVGTVIHPISQSHLGERLGSEIPTFLGAYAGIHQRQLHIVQAGGPGQQVEGLKDETDLLVPDPGQLIVFQFGDPVSVEPVLTGCRAVQAADEIHQGRLAGARWPHNRNELVFPDGEIDASQGSHNLATHVVLPLEIAGYDHGVARNIGRQHGHPFLGIEHGAGHSFRPIRPRSAPWPGDNRTGH
jgi:hypothetical protein